MIKDALLEFGTAANVKVWEHDRSKTVGGSEIGHCARHVWYVKKGAKPDTEIKQSSGAALRGTLIENHYWLPALQKKYGERLIWAGKDQKTFADKFLSVTPDGLITNLKRDALKGLGIKDIKGDCVVVESKSIDPRVNLSKEKSGHHFQTQVQMGMIRAMTHWKPSYAVISYVDASFLDEVDEFVVEFDPKIFKTAHDRAEEILTAKKPEQLKPEGWIAGGRECGYCAFRKQCDRLRRTPPAQEQPVDKQFAAYMHGKVSDINAIELRVETLQTTLKALQEEVKQDLKAHNTRKVPGIVNWSAVKGRVSYNDKAIRELAQKKGIDISKFETVGEPTDRLQILI